ncbi:MAG: RHS repeat domain-containing protein [Janthinobacterium lividum]
MPVSAFLPAGTYYLSIQLTTPRYIQAVLSYSYVVRQYSPFRGKPGGGTRIRRIASYDGIDHRRDIIKEYYYRDDANTHSTGKLSHDMAFATWVDKWHKVSAGTFATAWAHCRYLQRSAQDVMGGAGTTAVADVGYDTVTVIQRSGKEIHKSQSIFTNAAPSLAQLGTNTSILPGYASRYNFYEQNGRLLSTLEWKVRTGSDGWHTADCQLVRRVDNVYTDSVVSRVDNLLIGGEFGDADSTNTHPCVAINAQQYHTQSFWSPLVARTTTLYGPQASLYTATTIRWRYQNLFHQQPAWEESTSGSGGTVLKRFKYASDYATSVASTALLQQQYMLTTPVEQQQWQQSPASARKWVGGTLTTYTPSASSGAVPTQVQQAYLAVPNLAVQEPQDATGAFTTLVSDPAYQPRAAYAYYGTGELAEQHMTGQPATSYVWGYDDHHLIASARRANLKAIAYTSFEPNAAGRWQFNSEETHYVPAHFTGTRGYQLDGTSAAAVRCNSLPAGEYELLVWAHGTAVPVITGANQRRYELTAVANTGGWRQHRFRVSMPASSTITINAAPAQLIWIDELRICPVEAQMTSYTHDPLVGETSQTGPDGRTTFYEYDGLGRLVRTRDEQGRILSQQQYHYAGK